MCGREDDNDRRKTLKETGGVQREGAMFSKDKVKQMAILESARVNAGS